MPSVMATAAVEQYTLSPHLQADFYAKLAQLQNDVLKGTHPAFRLSQATRDQFARALLPPPSPLPSKQPDLPLQNGYALPKKLPDIVQPSPQKSTQRAAASPKIAVPFGSRPATSSIDPVLLTKSDDLVRAENNLRRGRIEKALREALLRKMRTPRDTFTALETSHSFDASKILELALETVKPVSGLVDTPAALIANGDNASNSSSFDENSYYSSQGNSWASEEVLSNKSNTSAEVVTHGVLVPVTTGVESPIDVSSQHSDEVLCVGMPSTNDLNMSGANGSGSDELEDAMREESYSPPAANAFHVPQTIAVANVPHAVQLHRNAQASSSYSPPSPVRPALQNHIIAPVAPQPARISPLAMRQIPGLNTQPGQDHSSLQEVDTPVAPPSMISWQQQKGIREVESRSPPSAPPTGTILQNPRKRRRRGDDNPDHGRKASRRNRQARSPELHNSVPHAQETSTRTAHIKPEPLSPTFVSANPPRRLILRDDGGADIEVLSPRAPQWPSHDVRENGVPRPVTDQATTVRYDPRNPYIIDASRPASPMGRQYGVRDDVDLRRLASVQHAQYVTRPASPPRRVVSYHAEDIRYARAQSHALIDRSVSRIQTQYSEQPPLSAHRLPDPYTPPYTLHDERQAPMADFRMAMPPPPPKRKIIIDEDGTEWLAVAAPPRQSVVRELPPVYDSRPYYHEEPAREVSRAVSHLVDRQPPRAYPQVIDLEDDAVDYRRMMPPPPPPPPHFFQPPTQRQAIVPRYHEAPEPPSRYTEVPEPRPRFVEVQDDPRYPAPYPPRQFSRALSVAPPPPPPQMQYGRPPVPHQFMAQQDAYQREFERAFSARPQENSASAVEWRRLGR